jgi:hypothetical protein
VSDNAIIFLQWLGFASLIGGSLLCIAIIMRVIRRRARRDLDDLESLRKLHERQAAAKEPAILPRDAVETTMPHATFGEPECCGCLVGLTKGDRADIMCNECGTVILSIPAASLRRTLDGLELSLEIATAICPHW